MPVDVREYTDFYASKEHATNVGIMFRGVENALQPNWLHLPVGYHGRASSVVLSGTPIRRPCGQIQKDREDPKQGSIFGACRLLDFELELGFFVGGPRNELGVPLTLEEAKERIFGVVLLNDWSARDLQAWEYVPLGPFTAKNFGTSISPWIVLYSTLVEAPGVLTEPSAGPEQQPRPLDYLLDPDYARSALDISLEVALQPQGDVVPSVISRTCSKYLYWSMPQQLTHHSITGAVMRAGDLLGTGTISGTTPDSLGSMLELSWRGSRPLTLENGDGKQRSFLQDHDTVIMTGFANVKDPSNPGSVLGRIGFGSVTGQIIPAQSPYLSK
jgi:fumarylacetoacetase